ncbi:MAG: peptidase A8 [Bacteroidetes bacterium SW_9_63_38]|nr:MAG: peptidase A8 [Bacteroidetes bacterium SW_9_63_38]
MRFLWLSVIVVAVDQTTKAAVLQFMASPTGIPRSIPLVGDWLRLTFTENPGMAFGITLGPPGTVTVLAVFATVLVAGYIYQVRDGYAPYVWSMSLIFGGAVGNIIDRIFYGVLLDYGTYFTGHVVDFIHVSLWKGFIPEAVPLIGGAYMELFPIWNVADMAIVLGVVGVLLFHRPFHRRQHEAERDTTENENAGGTSESSPPTERSGLQSGTDPAPDVREESSPAQEENRIADDTSDHQ